MKRTFFIGIVMLDDRLVLLENIDGVLQEPADKPFYALAGGDPLFNICKALRQFYEAETIEFSGPRRIFVVSNLTAEIITVDSDSSLMFIRPLKFDEMNSFWKKYMEVGNYC